MAIARNPKRNTSIEKEREAEAFISGAGQTGTAPAEAQEATSTDEPNKKPIMVRIDPKILERIDHAAKRLGISRSAFIVSSAAERLERME